MQPTRDKQTIWVKPSCFSPEFTMIIEIPEDRDSEEYIDELRRSQRKTVFTKTDLQRRSPLKEGSFH